MNKKSFASDNYAGVHTDILDAIIAANKDHVPAYGSDEITSCAHDQFKKHFGNDVEIFFVLNGTAANVLSLQAMAQSYHGVICADTAHIQMDECGAPEKFTGCKLVPVPTSDGKLTVSAIQSTLARIGDQHAVQPRVISISQSTEYGTVYSRDELKHLADYAHANNLYVHMDGARIANAAASLNLDLKSFTRDAGVDVLSFGGTKNGMMMGEAVVIFNKKFAENFQYIRKQGMQLASKMRFISAQFHALMSHDLWLRNAKHANAMAALFVEKIQKIASPAIRISHPVQANAIFVVMPEKTIQRLQQQFHFYVWNEKINEVRLMTSFDTTESDINDFIDTLHREMINS